jgi:hypothetical protein
MIHHLDFAKLLKGENGKRVGAGKRTLLIQSASIEKQPSGVRVDSAL